MREKYKQIRVYVSSVTVPLFFKRIDYLAICVKTVKETIYLQMFIGARKKQLNNRVFGITSNIH